MYYYQCGWDGIKPELSHAFYTLDPKSVTIEKIVLPVSSLNQLDLQDDTYISAYDRKKLTC